MIEAASQTTDPLTTGWTFSKDASTVFSDNGTIGGHRQLAFGGSNTNPNFGQIQKTLTSLVNGSTSFSVTFLEAGGGAGANTAKLIVDGVTVASGNANTGSAVVLSGTATIAGGQSVITLQVTADNNVGPVSRTYDIYSLSLSASAVTASPSQGSYTYTGETVGAALLRHYTVLPSFGAYIYTGFTVTATPYTWVRQARHIGTLTNQTRNSGGTWTTQPRNTGSFANQPKH